jgi:hypothetical protein
MASDVKLQANGDARPQFQCVSFYVEEIPEGSNTGDPNRLAVDLAIKMFEFQLKDFNVKLPGRYYGRGRYGHTFEVQVGWDAANALAAKSHPNVLNVFE